MTAPTNRHANLADAAERFAQHLTPPGPPQLDEPWMGQSLAKGAAGIALLHIERAHTGHGTWRQAQAWISSAVTAEISAADTSGLYLGAPAIAFMLHAASHGSTTRYSDALQTVHTHVTELAHRRTDTATARIHRGELPTFREYDLFYGLTGIGTYLLHTDPGGSTLERILRYLVDLTRPLRIDGRQVPGWWVHHDPHLHTSPQTDMIEAVEEDVQRSETMLAGALVISPRAMPEGLGLTYPEACKRLGLQPRAKGYALWTLALIDPDTARVTRSTLVTTLAKDTRNAMSIWRMGVECALPDLVCDQARALVTTLDGWSWPMAVTPMPQLADPATFDDE